MGEDYKIKAVRKKSNALNGLMRKVYANLNLKIDTFL